MTEHKCLDEKPKWWPGNPYPIEVFPMKRDDYAEVVPDPDKRTALSGMLGREFWDIASGSIWNAYQVNQPDSADLAEKVAKEIVKYFDEGGWLPPEFPQWPGSGPDKFIKKDVTAIVRRVFKEG